MAYNTGAAKSFFVFLFTIDAIAPEAERAQRYGRATRDVPECLSFVVELFRKLP